MDKRVILSRRRALSCVCGVAVAASIAGCHDGPMYALKQVNPYFTMKEWAEDERLGPTDATRAEELKRVVAGMSRWSEADQRRWLVELERIMEHDQSPFMRGLAVQAAASSRVSEATKLLERGVRDDDFKVRMITAKALGNRPQDPEATRLLAEVVNTETNKDVRLAAIKSLGRHSGPIATEALKSAVQETELAYQHAAASSLRAITGQQYGDEPEAWVAYLENQPVADTTSGNSSWTDRVRGWF